MDFGRLDVRGFQLVQLLLTVLFLIGSIKDLRRDWNFRVVENSMSDSNYSILLSTYTRQISDAMKPTNYPTKRFYLQIFLDFVVFDIRLAS